MEWILATDIDNTLTGDRAALDALRAALDGLRANGRLRLILSTGRRLDHVLAGQQQEGLPQADAVISQVGTEIYLPPFDVGMAPLAAWDARLRAQFDAAEARRFLDGIAGLVMQPARYNTPLKVSAYLDQAPAPETAVARIRQRIVAAGAADRCQVVWSSGRDLDIIPAAAGKGRAVRFLVRLWDAAAAVVLVAGDSGNDRSMFDEWGRGVVVANAQPELLALRGALPAGGAVYFAERPFAAGVAEGLRHFGVL